MDPSQGCTEAARKNWQKHARTEVTALNIDVALPLTLTEEAEAVEIPDYYKTWAV